MPVDELRAEIDRRLRTRRFLGYYESREWADEAAPVVEAIREEVASSPTQELVRLIERAVGRVVKVILRADDSDGLIGALARELLDLHAQACDAGVADPVKLARWMIRFAFDDQDFFEVDPVRYASALGDSGLPTYRREVEQRREKGDDSFAARYASERLAVLDGDIDVIIDLLGGPLNRPYDFIRVSEAMKELGRDGDVLTWAGRGIAETSGWQVAQLYDLAAEVYRRRRDHEALLQLRRDQHDRMPSASSYELLRQAAEEALVWQLERPAARSLLAEHDLGGLVDVLLSDGEPDEAWRAATESPDWDAGERRWMRLAEAREPSHPEDAMVVYLRLADHELETTGRSAYMRGTRMLKRARRAATAAERSSEFADHLHELRDRYRRRPTLIEMLDKAKLA
ncbi:MAG: hypothetical protein ACRDYE_12805 [Acidimicrobiales bacterium]